MSIVVYRGATCMADLRWSQGLELPQASRIRVVQTQCHAFPPGAIVDWSTHAFHATERASTATATTATMPGPVWTDRPGVNSAYVMSDGHAMAERNWAAN